MNTELKLISMRDIQTEDVQWLWYPYLPRGKLTIVQGDPGEGKTTFVLAVISALTRGEPLPECGQAPEPVNVIYQTAEDGLADTIKPRLEAAGADCARVLVIDESKRELNLSDVPFPVSWTVKMKKKQKETQDILSYHTQAAGCSDKARAKASGGRQPIEECGRTGL